MALTTLRAAYLPVQIAKAGKESQAKNHRWLELNGKRLRWDASAVNRDQLMGKMKAFEVVTADMLNPMWADQRVSLPEGQGVVLVANRVKGMVENAEIWKLTIDANRGVVVSAEVALGSQW